MKYPRKKGSVLNVFAILILCVLIFYQVLITLILPLRFNIFVLFLEVILLLFFLGRVIWPY